MSERPEPRPEFHPVGTVVPVEDFGYFIRSATLPGGWWLVTNEGCTCPARKECWHMRRVVEAVSEWVPAPKPYVVEPFS